MIIGGIILVLLLCCIGNIVGTIVLGVISDFDNDSDKGSNKETVKEDKKEPEAQMSTIDELAACNTEDNDKMVKVEGFLQAPTSYLFCYGTCTLELGKVAQTTDASVTIDTWITLTETDGKNTVALHEVNTGIDSFTFRDKNNEVIDPLSQVSLTGTWAAYETDGETSCYLKVTSIEQ